MDLSNRTYLFIGLLIIGILPACSDKEPTKKNVLHSEERILIEAESLLVLKPLLALDKAIEIANKKNNYKNKAELIHGKALAILGKNDEAKFILNKLLIDSSSGFHYELSHRAKFEMGKILYYQGAYDSALILFNELVPERCKQTDTITYGWILLFQGKGYRVKGEYAKSQQCYIKSKAIANAYNSPKLLVSVLISMGKNDIVEGNRDLALKKYIEAYKLSESIPDLLLSGDVCNHLGGYYLQTGQFDKALEYHSKSLILRQKLNAPDEIGQSYNNIGKTFIEMENYDSARYYFRLSIDLFNKTHYMKGLVKTLTNLGKLSLLEKKNNEAKKYLKEAFYASCKTGYNLGIAESSLSLGDFFNIQNKPDSAIYYFQVCIDKLKSSDYDELLLDLYSGMHKAYILKGNFKEALNQHEKLLNTEKHKLNVENNLQLANLLLEFDYERKEKDNRILKKENELKSLLIKRNELKLWFSLIALFLTILLCTLIFKKLKFKEKANKQLKKLNIHIKNQNNELEKLNYNLKIVNQEKDKLFSIIAHELRNPLYWFQNLTAMLSKNFKEMNETKLQKSIASLNDSAQNTYHLMDNLLFWSRSQLNRIIPRRQEIELSDKLKEVTNLFKNITDIKGIILETSLSGDKKIFADPELLACILRNLVSNAIKYTPNNGTISISTYSDELYVYFIIKDTGIGFTDKSFGRIFKNNNSISLPGILNEKGSGIGLKLCKEFIEMHQGNIWLESECQKGTKICFSLSKKEKNNNENYIYSKNSELSFKLN